jgi:hypothetical protein
VTAWSYSRYADYKLCPFKFKCKHIDRIKDQGSAAMDRGSAIHKEGEVFLSTPGKRAVPASYKAFQSQMLELKALKPVVEQQWGFTQQWTPTGWFGNDTWLRIVLDAGVRYEDNTADVIDFKTGKKYATNEEQVELFSTAPFMKWPDTTHVTTRLWYLDVPDKDENEVIREYTRRDYDLIRKDWTKRVVPMFNDTKFAPRPNDKCKWCSYRKEAGGPCKF